MILLQQYATGLSLPPRQIPICHARWTENAITITYRYILIQMHSHRPIAPLSYSHSAEHYTFHDPAMPKQIPRTSAVQAAIALLANV